MIDRILDRYSNRECGDSESGNETQEESVIDDFGSFGFLRGSRERAPMLELRKKDGSVRAVAYGYIDKADFEPSEGITLHLTGLRIVIKGRSLNSEVKGSKVRLFEALCRHRVPWLREADQAERFVRSDDIVVEAIDW